MKTLYLLRHAKSAHGALATSGASGGGDFDRPLAERGRGDAPKMAKAMASRGYLPQHVISSSAARTRETWALMAPELPGVPPAIFDEKLYLASTRTLLGTIHACAPDVNGLLLLGHNPAMAELAKALAGPHSNADARARLAAKFPTAGLAVIRIDGDSWQDVGSDRAETSLTDFIIPKDFG